MSILEDGVLMLATGMVIGAVSMAITTWIFDQEQRELERKKLPKPRFYNPERLNLSWPEYKGFPRKETKNESAR